MIDDRKPLGGGNNRDVTMAAATSPSPTRMTGVHDQDPNTPPSQGTPPSSSSDSWSLVTANSPQTARSSNTGASSSSSGHGTQAASTTSSSGHPSVLSTISETDREVMEANKEAKRRRGLQGLRNLPQLQQKSAAAEPTEDSVHSSSTNSNSTNPHRYLALQNSTSPVPLREGANDPVERFFIDDAAATNNSGGSSSGGGQLHPATAHQRSQSTRSQSTTTSGSRPSVGRTGSPATQSSFSASSSSGTQEEPPTFVSYMDRQGASDLTSLREETQETSSKRGGAGLANNEEREGSPAAELLQVGQFNQEVVFQEAQPKAIRPDRIRGRLDKFRTGRPAVLRPPRSPVKGYKPSTTPPPRGSHSPITALSPPRDIVEQYPHSHVISKPYVMRMGQHSSLVLGGAMKTTTTTTTTASAVEHMIGLTYAESSIEVLQSDLPPNNKEEERQQLNINILNIVTPEKEGSSASSSA
jgi:hypothetical protein